MRRLAKSFRLLLILFVIAVIVYLYWGSTTGAIFWRRSTFRTWVHQVEWHQMGLRDIIEKKLSKPISRHQDNINRFVTAQMDVPGFVNWLRLEAIHDSLIGCGVVWERDVDALTVIPLSMEVDTSAIRMLHDYLDAKYQSEYLESHKPRWKDSDLDSMKAVINRRVGFSTYSFRYYLDPKNYPTRRVQAEALKVAFGIIWNCDYYRRKVLPDITSTIEADPREYGLNKYDPIMEGFYNGILLIDSEGDTIYDYGVVQVPRDDFFKKYSVWPWFFEQPVEWTPGWRLYVQFDSGLNPMLRGFDLAYMEWGTPSDDREDRLHAVKMITMWLMAPWLLAERPPMLPITLAVGTLFLMLMVQIVARNRQRDFIAHVSHELRTPVAKVKLFAETLRFDRAISEEKEDEYLDTILRESDHLTVLVDNTLNLARLDAGRMTMVRQTADLSAWLQPWFEKQRISLTGSGFSAKLTVEGDLPQVKFDPEALELALNNLTDNAVKYSAERKEIDIQAFRKGKDRVQIAVSDRGIGIPAGKRKAVFKRFTRIKLEDREPVGGAGVGLSIVKEIVKRHRGHVWCQAQEGGGTTFIVELPVSG